MPRRVDDRALQWRLRRNIDGVYETESSVRIELELPGVVPERIHIEVSGSQVRVRIDRSVTFVGDEDTLYMIDDRFSGFERSFELPAWADLCAARAFFSRDTLTVIAPKRMIRRTVPVERQQPHE